jgi:nicotinate-nucleotide pyrophosphorylase (carboxylating)
MKKNNRQNIKRLISIAIKEDIPSRDISTELIPHNNRNISAAIIAKEKGIICGLDVVSVVFKYFSLRVKVTPLVKDGSFVMAGEKVATVTGPMNAILPVERVALNLLGHLSGIATKTYQFVKLTKGSSIKIMDTRKTLPGLRSLEKYAVSVGGGTNHRMNLSDGILFKDNHLQAHMKINNLNFSKAIKTLVSVTRRRFPEEKIEVEVKNLIQLKAALVNKVDIIMLDNFTIFQIKKALKLREKLFLNKKCQFEVSGNITLNKLKKLIKLKIERISVGSITHSAEALDFTFLVI